VKNKRYIRLAKKMKAHCTGNCDGGSIFQCKYYHNCFYKYILLPKRDDIRYLQSILKGQVIKRRIL
jgi:hypothetical protein